MKIIAKNSSLVFKQTVLPENLYKEENVKVGFYDTSNKVGQKVNIVKNNVDALCYCVDNVSGKTLYLKVNANKENIADPLYGFLADSNDIITYGKDTNGFGSNFWATDSVHSDGVYTKKLIIPENSNKLLLTIKFVSETIQVELSNIEIYDITDYHNQI